MKNSSKIIVLALFATVSACHSDSDPAPPAPADAVAAYDVEFGDLPYPHDVYFFGSVDGTLEVEFNVGNPFAVFVTTLDGFSTNVEILFPFSEALDATSLVGDQSVFLYEVTTDPVTRKVTAVVSTLVPDVDYTVGLANFAKAISGPGIPEPDSTGDDTLLEIEFLRPLNEKSSVLVLVTNGVQGSNGSAAVESSQYAEIRQTIQDGGNFSDPRQEFLKELVASHLDAADAEGVDSDSVIASTSFTTLSVSDVMDAVNTAATPQISGIVFTGLDTSLVSPLLSGAAEIYAGIVQVPYFLSKADPLEGFWLCLPTPGLCTASNPLPLPTETLAVPVLITAPGPKSAYVMAGGMKPPGGWPVVIYSHGITRNRSDMLAVADGFAGSGWAVIAIDHPLHGITDTMSPLYTPGTERTFDLDLVNNADLSPGPDGIIDDSGTHFINIPSPLTFRDNNRQASADLISLTASIPTMDIDGGGADFDAAQIHFLGMSLGSMEGTAYLASNTDVRAAVISVPGARWTQLALNSETFAPRIIGGLEAAGFPYGTLLFNKFIRDVQNTVDSADPLNFGAAASANHPVLLQEVVGDGAMVLPDQVIPNLVTEQLIDVMQLPSVTTPGPNPGPWGAVRFIAGSHGSLIDPTSSLAATTEMQTEAVVFIAGVPMVLPGDGMVILISDPTVIRDN